jgi:tetratricopeptide (TPR) repeat protein
LFERAVALDPGFARAHSALSFLRFQAAFLGDESDWPRSVEAARRHAERGIELDPLDPFVNFTMGRCHWLEGDVEGGLSWLRRATTISPHYAQGIYACAWSEAMLGDAAAGRRHADLAMRLSPLDPLHYAMLCTRAFTHVHAREYEEAADWAYRAACSPDAHVLIDLIAASTQWLAGKLEQADEWAGRARQRQPGITREDFFRSFPMRAPALRQPITRALEGLGY